MKEQIIVSIDPLNIQQGVVDYALELARASRKQLLLYSVQGMPVLAEADGGMAAASLDSREGVDVQSGPTEGATNLTYLRIPVKGYWFFRKNEDAFRPKLFVGPSVGILLDADAKFNGAEVDIKDTYSNLDLGLLIGAGFNARIATGTWFNFDAGYTHGLLDVADDFEGKNRSIGVTAGVLFGF